MEELRNTSAANTPVTPAHATPAAAPGAPAAPGPGAEAVPGSMAAGATVPGSMAAGETAAGVTAAGATAADPALIGGRTAISEQAVAKVAAIAARAVPGVYALGNPAGRALGAVRDAVGGSSATQGVHVEVGEREAAVDVSLVAVYGNALTTVANNVRAAVYGAVEELVGLRVVEVNVDITDVHLATDGPDPVPRPVTGAKSV